MARQPLTVADGFGVMSRIAGRRLGWRHGQFFFVSFVLFVVSLTGCTLVPCDRAFPKLDWYWSADAVRCRHEQAMDRQLYDPPQTNSPAR